MSYKYNMKSKNVIKNLVLYLQINNKMAKLRPLFPKRIKVVIK